MSNSIFWNDIQQIIDEGFSSNGLNKLELYAEQFINQQLVYKRFSSFEQHGCAAEVLLMLLQPFSREQMLEQIMLIHSQTISKENVNAERRKNKE